MQHYGFPEGPDGIKRGYPVETPVGVMYLNPTGWGTLVDNSSSTIPHHPVRPTLTARGRDYTATIGIYANGELERCYVSRAGSFSVDNDAPRTVREAIVNAAREAVTAWRADNPGLVAEAEHYDARQRHASAARVLETAKQDYDAARKAERAARRAMDRTAARLTEGVTL